MKTIEDLGPYICSGDPDDLNHECGVWYLAGFRVGDNGEKWRAHHQPRSEYVRRFHTALLAWERSLSWR